MLLLVVLLESAYRWYKMKLFTLRIVYRKMIKIHLTTFQRYFGASFFDSIHTNDEDDEGDEDDDEFFN